MTAAQNPAEGNPPLPRRQFLGAGLTALGAAALTACASGRAGAPHPAPAGPSPALIGPGSVVLFQGDSITDSGRSRERAAEANVQAALGSGYACMAAMDLLLARPGQGLSIFNRGVSGNEVVRLAERWDEDCLALAPDVLSILIGINDIWHVRDGTYDGTLEIYEHDYDALLTRTRGALPQLKLVVCEPFVLRCGVVDESWFPEFDRYRAAALRVASTHGATWVPFQALFDEAVRYAPPEHWAGDGVHPTAAGAALMAQAWLRAVGA